MKIIEHTKSEVPKNSFTKLEIQMRQKLGYPAMEESGKIIVRCPPTKRIISQSYEEDEDFIDENNLHKYFVSLPEMIFRIDYKKYKCVPKSFYESCSIYIAFVSKGKLYRVPFYNTSDNGAVCIEESTEESLEELTKSCINDFWKTGFTGEIRDNYIEYAEKKMTLGNFKKWQEKTKANPEWIPDDEYLINLPVNYKRIFNTLEKK